MSKPKTETAETEAPATPDPAASAEPGPHDKRIDNWFARHFHGLGSSLDVTLYNHIHAAKEDLKAELRSI